MPKNIILNYKDEEKIIHEVPNNFIDLKDFFLSLFDESNDEIYLFRYKRTGKKNKVKIEIKDDLFKENMKEIDQNNYTIFIIGEKEAEGEVIEVEEIEEKKEEKKEEEKEEESEEIDIDIDEYFEDENNNNVKEEYNLNPDTKKDEKPAKDTIQYQEKNNLDNLDEFFSEEEGDNYKSEINPENNPNPNTNTKKEEGKKENETDDIKKLKEELLKKDEEIKEMKLKMKKLEDELNEVKTELNECKEKNVELTLKVNTLTKTKETQDNYIDELESRLNEG